MSIAAAGPADYGQMASLISDSATVKQNLDLLTTQISTGLVSNTYAGLGSGTAVSLNLNPQIAALQTWQNNINQAASSMQVTQTAMTQIQQIASNFLAETGNLEGADASEVDSVAAAAQQALVQVAGLLDTQDGNTYVFAGQDTTNPPVPDPDSILSSQFYTQIAAQVGQLGTQGATATTTNTLAIAGSNAPGLTPFSAYLSQPAGVAQAPAIEIGQGQTASVGLLASANSAVTSTGVPATSTGSYMRDLMLSLATIGSLSSSQVSDSGYTTLVQSTNTTLTGAISAMAEDVGVLGNTQTNLTTDQTTMADTATALTTQVGDVQDVDVAQAMSNLSLVQTQLQGSYQVIAAMSGLSLAKYLPVS
ncbi:MAG TPA: flagellin [Acetobacteraceae bacterium]|jgi:flagellar hook-associated protein 3 FlgL|nr:flagellin [Acetobacteraceae bacterium]